MIFRDPDRPLGERVDDLLGRLTLTEKIGLLHQHQAPVERLGLPAFTTGTEALHGLAWHGPATVFPQAVGLGSSWDPELLRAVGAAVGDEVRAFHHAHPADAGLNVWAPVVNPLRDPRWGRNEEGYSEDPLLTGVLATAFAQGLRGDHPRYLKTAPTLKHFLGYNNETDRDTTSSNLSPRVLHEYELPAFRAPIAAGAAVAVMCSYNLVNGRPAHLSPLINEELRHWSDEELLVVSDAGAAGHVAGVQHYCPDHVTGFSALLRAGIDSFTEDSADAGPTVDRLTEGLRRGLITESDVDAAVRRVLSVRFRLGDLDASDPFSHTPAEVIDSTVHRTLAREAARQSMVLLRNASGLLPLRAPRTVAVIGPLSDVVHADWYSGTLPYAVTARAAITAKLGTDRVVWCEGLDRIALSTGDWRLELDVVDWGQGVVALRGTGGGYLVAEERTGRITADSDGPSGWFVRETFRLVTRPDGTVLLFNCAADRFVLVSHGALMANAAGADDATAFTVTVVHDGLSAVAEAAARADVAVVVAGSHPFVNGRETVDRADLALPDHQDALLRTAVAANPRTVLVLASGYPFAITWADTHVPAILWSSHGGQEYGNALAAVLFGAADPGGRLTQTWYRGDAQLPDLLDYDIIDSDATYLYFRGDPVYPFGHGLSYTTFGYDGLRLSTREAAAGDEVEVSVRVTNTGTRTGDEVVQLYTRQRRSRVKQPLRQLRGFAKVTLAPGESTTVRLTLAVDDLALWDESADRPLLETATHTVAIGRSCVDIVADTSLAVSGPPPLRSTAVGRPGARVHVGR